MLNPIKHFKQKRHQKNVDKAKKLFKDYMRRYDDDIELGKYDFGSGELPPPYRPLWPPCEWSPEQEYHRMFYKMVEEETERRRRYNEKLSRAMSSNIV